MKSAGAYTVLTALLVGMAAFFLARALQDHRQNRDFAQRVEALERDTRANLAWMRKELSLTEEEFARECEIHEAHMVEYHRLCAELKASRERMKEALQGGDQRLEASAIREYELHFEACERAAIQHVKKVAASMPPEAGRTYLKLMLSHLFPEHDPVPPTAAPTHSPP